MMPASTFRLAVVNSHPIQYFAPLYAYLNKDPKLEITALYCSDSSLRGGMDPGFKQPVKWDVDLLAGYASVFLGSRARQRTPGGFWSLICPEAWKEIRSGCYDGVLVHGYGFAAFVLAMLAAKSKGLPVFVRSETHLDLKRSSWKKRFRDTVLSLVYRHFDGFFAIGSANRKYYMSLGVPVSKIFDVPYTVDNDRFIASANISSTERSEIRSKYGLPPDRTVVLYASKFMPRKHPDVVIRAVAELSRLGIETSLFMVGTGEMAEQLRSLVESLGLRNVVFGGFVNQTELPRIYAASDVFVLPSEDEPWGLIVNEVMCAGVPVVVSSEVGCVPDIVEDGVNGWHILAGDVPSLVTALKKLLSDQSVREGMGRASQSIIRGWSYERCRIGILAAVNHVESAERSARPLVGGDTDQIK
jgi:glycosyltransferase involved in cell wall biosynthesis